jgi:Protein of unknown function (DUF3102)
VSNMEVTQPVLAPAVRTYNLAVGILSSSASRYASRIAKLWEIGQSAQRQAFETALQIGELLNQAKAKLPHGQFEHMVRDCLPFDERHAQRLMRVASHAVLTKTDTVSLLPPSVSTQYELSRLDNGDLVKMIEDGTIHPGITRDDAVFAKPRRKPTSSGFGPRPKIIRCRTGIS